MSNSNAAFSVGLGVGFLVTYILAFGIYKVDMEFALDVYRGKTTLEITYRDSVALDSVVVYKMK